VSKIIQTVLQALKYCHSKNVMHKDIKPKKILVNDEGVVKIVDFAISKWDFMSKFQMLAGTPYYLAPEVLKDIKNAKSDVWSLGVVMYALLSGFLPFVSDGNETVFHKVIKGEYNFDHPLWENVSEEATELISHMINIDIVKRYTVEECLYHEWFETVKKKEKNENFSSILAKNLEAIKIKSLLQGVAYKFIKKTTENENISQMEKEFQKV